LHVAMPGKNPQRCAGNLLGKLSRWPWYANSACPSLGRRSWPIYRALFRPWPIRIKLGPLTDLANLKSEDVMLTIDRVLHTMFEELRNNRGWDDRPEKKWGWFNLGRGAENTARGARREESAR